MSKAIPFDSRAGSDGAGAPEDPPLSTTWRNWIEGFALRDYKNEKDLNEEDLELQPAVDVVVVGSGYGGAVAALRLAEKGYRVLVLERGSEYLPGDFPNHFSQLTNYVRANIPTQPMPAGRAGGLFEFSVGQGIVGVTGNGLGGGSLINAGVVLEPDADVFAQAAWPAALRAGQPAAPEAQDSLTLAQAFTLARRALGASPFTPPTGTVLPKAARFRSAVNGGLSVRASSGEKLSGTLAPADLTVRSAACVSCGDCASGCNTPGAKGDLRSTYLARAVATGRVQIVTQAQVYRFAPEVQAKGATNAKGDALRWKLWVFGTDTQHHKASPEEAAHVAAQGDRGTTLRIVRAQALIISAGTLGSTQLLQRSQAQQGSGLAFSAALGTRLSGNGDTLSAVVNTHEEPVRARGWGSVPPDVQAPPPVGPTITTVWDGRAKHLPLTQRIVLQDGAVPGALGRVFEELLSAGRVMQQMDGWSCGKALEGEDRLAASNRLAQHTQVWLSMGHDGSPGRILWMPGSDASAMVMPSPEKLDTYRAQQRLFDSLGRAGTHLHSPLWQALPEAMTRLMSGAKPSPVVTSVHLLGGCPMGDDPDTGVVDHLGRVWIRDPSHPDRSWAAGQDAANAQRLRNEPQTYPGLCVLDGSVVATSLGCNPLLTITALAERAISAWPSALPPRPGADAVRNPPRPARAPRLPPVTWTMRLRESLLASDDATGPWGGARQQPLRLDVEFLSQDFEAMLHSRHHPIRIDLVRLTLNDGTVYHLATDRETLTFHFLPDPGWRSHGWWPLLWASTELLAVAAVLSGALTVWWAHGRWALAALLLALCGAMCVTLPFWRTLITWLEGGGWQDIRNMCSAPKEGSHTIGGALMRGLRGVAAICSKVVLGFRQIVHAREKRVMRYQLTLERACGQSVHPQRVYLNGTKRVAYRATSGETLQWLGRALAARLRTTPRGATRPPTPRLRPTYWERVMDAQTSIRDARTRRPLFKGTLRMTLDQLLTSDAAQLGERGDTTTGLLTLAGYATLALRFAALTHITDFRAPNYSGAPVLDASGDEDTQIRVPHSPNRLTPRLHWITVPRGESLSDKGHESTRDLQLRLWQYPQERLKNHNRCGAVRVKAVLLLHAFGQSGLAYTFKDEDTEGHQNLAEHLHQQGFEVWVLDSRMSTRSGHAESPFTVDMMALHDVPVAVDAVIASCRQRLTADAAVAVQIAMFGQCIGSASAWMSILLGKLHQGTVSKLYGYASSQVHPLMKASAGTRNKAGVPLLLRHLLPYVPFAVREQPASLVWQFMDRLFNSFPVPDEERRDRGKGDALATCRRIRFVEAPLFLHENMSETTIRQMPLLFGNANLRLFSHARRFVEPATHLAGVGRLVDEDGFDRYVTGPNARQHVRFPVLLLHGERNDLFDAHSAEASRSWLNAQGAWQRGSGAWLAKDHGHLDVLLGRRAHQAVFPRISGFFDEAFQQPDCDRVPKLPSKSPQWHAVTPLHGPVLSWVSKHPSMWLVHCSLVLPASELEPNDPHPFRFLIVCRHGQTSTSFSMADQKIEPIRAYGADGAIGARDRVFNVAVRCQLEVPVALQGDAFSLEIHAFLPSAHAAQYVGPSLGSADIVSELERFFDAPTRKQSTLSVSNSTLRAVGADAEAVDIWSACCRYPGWTIDAERIDRMATMALNTTQQPAFGLLVGDQIYADATAGLLDPTSPIERYFERHLTAFNTPTMGRWMRCIPTVMTPDDHEWIDNHPHASPLLKWPWPDLSNGSQYRRRLRQIASWADKSIDTFQKSQWPGSATKRSFTPPPIGPVSLFVMDSRISRQPGVLKLVHSTVLQDLSTWISELPRGQLPMVVTGSVVLPGLHPDVDPSHPGLLDTWQYAPNQRLELLNILCGAGRPFVLLSGDYHVSGAFAIQCNGRTVGAAVIAPPMYAPLPYANTRPHQLYTNETFTLPTGAVNLASVVGGEAASGSGWCQLRVERLDGVADAFSLQVARTLMPLGEESPSELTAFTYVARMNL